MVVWGSRYRSYFRKSADFSNTLRQTNIAMENGLIEDVFPIENWGYSIAMLVYQRVPS